MCDFFWEKDSTMEGEGDLSDIIRSAQPTAQSQSATWPLQTGASILAEPSNSSSNGFSDPFESLREALFDEVQDQELFEEIKMPRLSCDESRVSTMLTSCDDMAKIGGVVVGPMAPSGLRGSGLGAKRRKGEAKKVVCIPAPIAIGPSSANGRLTSGSEVVPSDLWAWRKYGQKPIKGSPYPRGYYRCSSSKGCSARKQVERSRTDPNMLVITYTSEHNHPWPTHRNALAGSTRGPLSKSLLLNPQNTSHIDHIFPSQVCTIKDEPSNMINNITRVELSNGSSLKQGTVEAGSVESESDPVSLMFSPRKHGEEKVEKVMDPFSLFSWFGENNSNF